MSSPTPVSRRARNSTVQSVDLLNSVNARGPNTTLSRPRVRKLNNKRPFVPRSDDVYSAPSPSPEVEQRPPSTSTANAPSTRSAHVPKQDPPSRASPTRNVNTESPASNHSPKIVLFSDVSYPDTDSPGKQSADIPPANDLPPNVGLFGHNDRDLDAREGMHGNANYGTSNINGIERSPSQDGSDDPSAAQARSELRGLQNDWDQAPDENIYTERQDDPEPTEFPSKRRRTDIIRGQKASAGSEPEPGRGGDNDANLEDSERVSLSGPEESAPGFDGQPQKRSNTESYLRPEVYVEIPTRPEPPAPGENAPEVEDDGAEDGTEDSADERAEDAAEQNATREGEAGEEEPGEDDPEIALFKEARKVGNQKENWKTFTEQTRILEKRSDPSISRSFDSPNTLIAVVQGTYDALRVELPEGRGISFKSIKECENLLGGISVEASQILDHVWQYSKRGRQDRAQDLLWGFETLVIPSMARLMASCFVAYYVGQGRFPKHHLHRTMTLLCSWCDRIHHQKNAALVERKILSKNLRSTLRKLISALESGLLNLESSEPSRINRRARPFSSLEDSGSESGYFTDLEAPTVRKKWTDEEGKALVEGLKLYQGPDRYIKIMRHFGSRLRDRTRSELHAEAQNVRDNYIPMIQEEFLRTAEGRRKMQWLLSV